MSMNIDEIMANLPHRYPFLMVDRVLECERGKRAVVIKNVTIGEPFFQGHYPDMPIMPGVMIVEAMAQAGGLAAGGSQDGSVPLLAAVEKVRFREMVRPGDQLVITVEVLTARGPMVKVQAKAEVDGNTAAEGRLTFVLSNREDAASHGTT